MPPRRRSARVTHQKVVSTIVEQPLTVEDSDECEVVAESNSTSVLQEVSNEPSDDKNIVSGNASSDNTCMEVSVDVEASVVSDSPDDAALGITVEEPQETKHDQSSPTVIELRCQICNCTFTNYHEHMNSEAHKASRGVSNSNSKPETSSNSFCPSGKQQGQKRSAVQGADPSSPPLKKLKPEDGDDPNANYCEVCNLTISRKSDFQLHLQGKRHNIALQKAAGKAYCERCYLFFNTNIELKEHMNSQLHKNNAIEKKSDNVLIYCDVCHVSSHGQLQRKQHLDSKKHKRMMLLKSPESGTGQVSALIKNPFNGQSEEPKKKWLYVCNGCNYYTNDDELMTGHMNQASHKAAVAKMRQDGLMCGTPAIQTASQQNSVSLETSLSNPKAAGVKAAEAKAASSAENVLSTVTSVSNEAPAASKPLQLGTNNREGPKKSPNSALKNLKKQLTPAVNKNAAALGEKRFNKRFNPASKQTVGYAAVSNTIVANNSISKTVYSNAVGGYGPSLRSISYESSVGQYMPPGNYSRGGPQRTNDIRENYSGDIRNRFENEFQRDGRSRREGFHGIMRGDFRDDYREDIRSNLREDNFANPRDSHLRGDLRPDVRSDLRRYLEDPRGNFLGDVRSDLRSDLRLQPRTDLDRGRFVDLRSDIRAGIGSHNDFPVVRKTDLGTDAGNYRALGRMEPLREGRDDVFRRTASPGYTNSPSSSLRGNGENYTFADSYGRDPLMGTVRSSYSLGGRHDPPLDHNLLSQSTYAQSSVFLSRLHFEGR